MNSDIGVYVMESEIDFFHPHQIVREFLRSMYKVIHRDPVIARRYGAKNFPHTILHLRSFGIICRYKDENYWDGKLELWQRKLICTINIDVSNDKFRNSNFWKYGLPSFQNSCQIYPEKYNGIE